MAIANARRRSCGVTRRECVSISVAWYKIEVSLAAVAALLVVASPAAAAAREHPPARWLLVHPRPLRPAAATLGIAVAPGLTLATPFTLVASALGRIVRVPHYIGPDGTYDERADLIRSIDGTPCGQACTRRSLLRWGYAPVD